MNIVLALVAKRRRKALFPNVLEFVKKVLEHAASRHSFSIAAFGSESQDRVHLVVEAGPAQPVSKLARLTSGMPAAMHGGNMPLG